MNKKEIQKTLDQMNALIHENFKNTKKILADPLRFKEVMGFTGEQYQKLNKAETFCDLLSAAGMAVAGGIAAQSLWVSSLGFFGKALFVLGLSSTPVGWIITGCLIGATGGYTLANIKKKIRETKNKNVIPKYINRPIDMIALSWASLVTAVTIKLAYADGRFSADERIKLNDILIYRYGYTAGFASDIISHTEEQIDRFSFKDLKNKLNAVLDMLGEKHAAKKIKENLVKIISDIIQADGVITEREVALMSRLKRELEL